MSDNGGLSTAEGSPTSNLPLRDGKGWVYEGGLREPLLIKWPGTTTAGSTSSEPVITTDFYPTLLAAAGLPPKPEQHLDGVSLVPLLARSGELTRDALFFHYPHYSNQGGFPGGAIRMHDKKLIERYEDGAVQLYDLKQDLSEQHDLSKTDPATVTMMRQRLHTFQQEVGAKFLRPQPGGPAPWHP